MKGFYMQFKIVLISLVLSMAAPVFSGMPTLDRSDNYAAIGHLTLGPTVTGFVDVAYSDAADINYTGMQIFYPPRGFAVFTAGTIKVTTLSGKVDAYADGELIPGAIYPWAIRRVWATGTTVTMVRIYF